MAAPCRKTVNPSLRVCPVGNDNRCSRRTILLRNVIASQTTEQSIKQQRTGQSTNKANQQPTNQQTRHQQTSHQKTKVAHPNRWRETMFWRKYTVSRHTERHIQPNIPPTNQRRQTKEGVGSLTWMMRHNDLASVHGVLNAARHFQPSKQPINQPTNPPPMNQP